VEKILDLIDADLRDNRIRITTGGVDPDVIVPKGSITIEGVSLTIAQVDVDWLEVAIIPTTQHVTTLGSLAKGDRVNVETDIVARTIAHVVRRMG
jgi:riboflavin synthase